ncbi:hypothetical protein BGZ83_007432 [Gryganskiella cystojenkinii]|nr:hypothetical protein BGZ83_007432 [Gryganskiella cystojenkinii]
MKRNSTQNPTSGTTPISFAAAAQKNTTKATPPPAQTPATTASSQTAPVQPTSAANASVPATQQTPPSSTATTTPSSGKQAAASNNNTPTNSSPSTSTKQQSAPKPVSTANGINYSAVAAKANAANRRSQVPPTAAAAVRGVPAKAAPVAAQTSTPAASIPAPASGNSASSIRFGSINDSGSEPAAAQDGTTAAPAASASMTFGSIAASGKIPSSKTEETHAVVAPVAAVAQETAQSQASQAPEHQNAYKPIPQHVPQPHMAHGHPNSHRRTDSTSSAHNDHPHFRAQVPPTLSQAPMMPAMGVPQSGPTSFTSQRPPIKNQGMGPMNPQPHGMHPHPQQSWQGQYYMPPQYDAGNYYQPMYPPMAGYVPQRPIPNRTFNASAPSFTPQAQTSKRIAIINPATNTEITPLPAAAGSPSTTDSKTAKTPVVIDIKNPEEEKKAIITPPAVKNAIKIVNPADREREERERKEKEEKERKEKEEKERLEREEKERIEREAKEAEERRIREEQEAKERAEAAARAEQERKEKEARELKEKEEREERERLEAERKRKEEEERIAREKAEAEAEKARLEKEKAELEVKEKLEAERRIALETEKLAEKVKQEELVAAQAAAKAETEKAAAETKAATPALESVKAGLSVDLARTVSAPSASPSARIDNFGAVSYPSHIQSPSGADAQGKFRYDRDFLMQFMNVCKEKPDSLPALDVLAEGNDRSMSAPGGLLRGNSRGPAPNGRGKPSQPMGAFNLGNMGNMGNMRMGGPMPMGGRNPSGDNRMHRSPSENNFNMPGRNGLSRPPSGRGSRGGKRGGGPGRGGDRFQEPQLTIPLADIVPLEKTENAWTPTINAATVPISTEEPLSQDIVARKVKGLLNKLTLEKFNSISDKILEIANLSIKETDGTTLKHCIQLIFEKATDEPNFGSVYAQLCQKLMDKASPEIKDSTVEGSTGGKLFRKYLLHRCQEEFVKGWKDKAAAGGVSLNDKDGPDLMSDEYYVLMKAKRQGLGLIHFIGELFKLGMLTEKIMHECIKKLLANVKEPEEEETEGLCKLLTTVGLQLDRVQAKSHMDVYFQRMVELTKSDKLPSRIRFMVQDVIDLRSNNWVNRRAASGPKTIAAIHEEAAKQAEEKELMRRTASSGGARGLPNRREQLSRGQSFRGGSGDARHDMGGVPQVGADGWSTVGSGPTPPKKAGDLSSFGNTSRSKGGMPSSLGPQASVFGSLSKKRSEAKAASQNEAPRQISSANPFDALEGETGDRRGSVDAEKPAERPKLKLLPRSVSSVAESEASSASEPAAETSSAPKKTEDEAKRSIENTLKEYLSIRDMSELLISVKELDACYRPLFVTEFVNQSMEMKQSDVDSIAEIFKKLLAEDVLSNEDFESGFADPLEFLPDTAIDVPNAYKFAAQLLEAAGMDPARAADA